MILSGTFCVDPGSDTIKVFDPGTGEIFFNKAAIAVNKEGAVYAVLEKAYAMSGITPKNIRIKTPVSQGKITDVLVFDRVLEAIFTEKRRFLGLRPEIYFSVPADMTEIERRAYASISKRGRLKNCTVYLAERAFADAVSFGVDIRKTKGNMIVNIGASATYASVISDGRIILERAIPIGGNDYNEFIISSIRRRNNLFIGTLDAEDLKKTLGGFDEITVGGKQITGLDTQAGLPRDGFVTAHTVRTAIKEKTDDLISQLEEFIHRIPPQVLEKVKEEGIYLAGGSAGIEGLSGYLARALNMPVVVSEHLAFSTVNGMKMLLEKDQLKSLSRTPLVRTKL